MQGLYTEIRPSTDSRSIEIVMRIPREAIGAGTDRATMSWIRERIRSPFKLLKLARQILEDEEKYRDLPNWSLNDVCEKCGRPNVPKED